MTAHHITPALAFNGVQIGNKGEMLLLTDMWKADGSDDARRPANWARKEGAPFIEAVTLSLNVPKGHIWKAQRGPNGGTYAHWQIALAYAKYLSPDFHMWCNTVVRERMEGKPAGAITLPPEVLEMIRRDDGISRMLAHKVTGIESVVQSLASAVQAIIAVVSPSTTVMVRHGKTAGQILELAGYRVKIKGLAAWTGNRLAAMSCRIPGNGKSENGVVTARLFDPDKALYWIENGGRTVIDQKISERGGQGILKLVRT